MTCTITDLSSGPCYSDSCARRPTSVHGSRASLTRTKRCITRTTSDTEQLQNPRSLQVTPVDHARKQDGMWTTLQTVPPTAARPIRSPAAKEARSLPPRAAQFRSSRRTLLELASAAAGVSQPWAKAKGLNLLDVSGCGTSRLPRECGVPPGRCRAGTPAHVLCAVAFASGQTAAKSRPTAPPRRSRCRVGASPA